jgi:hypothetical protein
MKKKTVEVKFAHKRELRYVPVSAIMVDETYRIHPASERTDLEATIPKVGIVEPLTCVQESKKIILLNGFDRRDVIIKLLGPDTMVPVWVITEKLTDKEKKAYILYHGQQRKKTKVQIIGEYHMWNQVLPNNQGKDTGGGNRYKLIANYLGISSSQLSNLLMVDKCEPSLLVAVDNGHESMANAMERCKQKRAAAKNGGNKNGGPPSKDINLDAPHDKCPTCNRPFHDLDWKDLPALFDYKRTEDDTTWMEPIEGSEVNNDQNTNPNNTNSDDKE